MGFLDNSGDIILDAVLTDLGRERLARGDGSFKITKFSVADDEIDYAKYNKDHPSGSAYYDLDILTTPVLEAFTNNIGSVKHKLMTIPRNNLLYLPVIKLVNNETIVPGSATWTGTDGATAGYNGGFYFVTVDKDTSDITPSTSTNGTIDTTTPFYQHWGVIKGDGEPVADGRSTSIIVTDQGLDTTKIPNSFQLDADLIENQYIIEIDDRLGKITEPMSPSLASVNFVDDDRIASYYISKTSNAAYFDGSFGPGTGATANSVIGGPRGTRLKFGIRASLELNTSTSLFDRLGGDINPQYGFTQNGKYASAAPTWKYIDSTVRITGVTTGYRLDIPIRFIKLITAGAA